MKLAIGMTTAGSINTKTVVCLTKMLRALKCEYSFITQEGCYVHLNRERIAQIALDSDHTHLLFIDSDMSFQPDAANKLIERDKDIVGVNYYRRQKERVSTVKMDQELKYKVKELYPDLFVPVNGLGTGFLLIKMEVFKKLPHPWFFFELDDKGEISLGEDYWLCKKAKDAGFEVWCDLNIPMKHIGDYFY